MKKLVVLAVLSLVFASGAAARGVAQPPKFPTLPGNWSHAEINVKIKRVPHTLILDRGRITQLSPTQLTLREADASVVAVPLNVTTIVTFRRGAGAGRVLRRAQYVETMRIDDGAAVRVLVLARR